MPSVSGAASTAPGAAAAASGAGVVAAAATCSFTGHIRVRHDCNMATSRSRPTKAKVDSLSLLIVRASMTATAGLPFPKLVRGATHLRSTSLEARSWVRRDFHEARRPRDSSAPTRPLLLPLLLPVSMPELPLLRPRRRRLPLLRRDEQDPVVGPKRDPEEPDRGITESSPPPDKDPTEAAPGMTASSSSSPLPASKTFTLAILTSSVE